MPPGDVQRDEFGTVTGVTGYATVPGGRLPGPRHRRSPTFKVPGPNGGYIVPQGFTIATELTPIVVYDAATDTFTNVQTGVVYTDNGEGSFTNPDNPEDELLPGWKENVGWQNFTAILTDPDVRRPFFYVFVWTFVYAILTVLLTFAIGLRPRDRAEPAGHARPADLPLAADRPVRGAGLPVRPRVGRTAQRRLRGHQHRPRASTSRGCSTRSGRRSAASWSTSGSAFPYMFLVSTGALQAIPSELQEAARIDGARNWQVFRLVNLPLLLVALTPLLVASFAFNFNNFNTIYLLTGGGPAMEGSSVAGATDILISYTYKIAFAAGKGNDFGLASAISIIIFLIVGTISAHLLRTIQGPAGRSAHERRRHITHPRCPKAKRRTFRRLGASHAAGATSIAWIAIAVRALPGAVGRQRRVHARTRRSAARRIIPTEPTLRELQDAVQQSRPAVRELVRQHDDRRGGLAPFFTVLIAAGAAYAFSRFRFKGRKVGPDVPAARADVPGSS